MNNPASNLYTVRQVATALGVSTSKIRYYCNHGLVRNIRRSRNGYRAFDEDQITWFKTLFQLSSIGFNLKDLKKYASLHYAGPETIPERKAMLATKKRQLWQQIEDLQAGIDFIERHTEQLEQEEGANLDTATIE